MSQKKFTSKDLLHQLRPTPELAYEFSNQQVTEGVKHFLRYVGYTLEENVDEAKLDFRATRKEGNITYQILGVVKHSMKEVADGIAQLRGLKKELGQEENTDYVIALPPVQERYLIDYMVADDYKLYKELRQNAFLVWICNPEEKSVWCCQGSPKDKRFKDYFKVQIGGDLIVRLATMPFRGDKDQYRKRVIEELMEQ